MIEITFNYFSEYKYFKGDCNISHWPIGKDRFFTRNKRTNNEMMSELIPKTLEILQKFDKLRIKMYLDKVSSI